MKKRAFSLPQDFMGWFFLGIGFLIFILIIIFILKEKMWNAIDYFKSFLRFRGSTG